MALFNNSEPNKLQPLGGYAPNGLGQNTPNTEIRCPMDIKQCSDGSYVGRDPSRNCAFRMCPDELAKFEEMKSYSQPRQPITTEPVLSKPIVPTAPTAQSIRQPTYRVPTAPIVSQPRNSNNLLSMIQSIFGR